MPFDFNQKVNGDITVYGKRTPIKFTVVFDSNGGVGEAFSINATFGEGVTMPEFTFTKRGYKFVGWQKIHLYQPGQVVEEDLTYTEGKEVVFKAEWESEIYTLTFDGDGADTSYIYPWNYQDCLYTADVFLPIAPTRDGYTFKGWGLNGKIYPSSAGVKVSDIAGSSNIIAFKAVWEAKEYTVHYVIYYGEDGIAEEQRTYKVGEKFTLPYTIYGLPAGYRLNYWYDGEMYSLGQLVSSENFGSYGENKYLYGDCWGITYYVECIDSVTGKNYGRISASYDQEIEFSKLSSKPYRRGYNYTWQLYNDDGTPYTGEEGKITTEAGKTVIAKTVYKPITYSVTFALPYRLFTGSKIIGSTSLEYDEEFTLPEEWCVANKGYTFLYYKKVNTAVEYYVAGSVIKNLTVSEGDDVWLYVQEKANSYSIAFDSNGGSGEMPVQSAICGDQITLNTNTFEKEGYYFTGWKYGEETYADCDTINQLLDEGTVITLVAQWGKNLNGEGTQLSPYKVSSYDDLVTMADMVDKSVLHSKAYYVLTADIDCQTQPIKAIGGLTNPFSGTFDGQNHIISYAKFERTGDYIGLFGYVQLGTLKNFGIKNFLMTGGDTAKYCGAVVGKYISENVIENVFAKGTIDLSFKFGTNVVAGVYVGGFVGNMLGSAENCYFEGSISASTKYSGLNTIIRTGGFAGVIYGNNLLIEDVDYSISATISNCYVNSSVTVDSSGGTSTKYITGGFAGALSKTDSEQIIIKHCVSIGDVKNINSSSNGAYGGFVGANNAGVDLTLVRRDSTSVCEGYGTAGPEVLKEDLSKLKNLQWLINEFGFSADIWADEYGLPMLKAYIKETV